MNEHGKVNSIAYLYVFPRVGIQVQVGNLRRLVAESRYVALQLSFQAAATDAASSAVTAR